MENQILKAHLLGYYSFKSKDKTKEFFKLQAVAYSEGNSKALLIDTFVTQDDYEKLSDDFSIFDNIDLQIIPNLVTGKIAYKILF